METINTLDSLLKDGLSLPRLISISLNKNIEEMKISKNPTNKIQVNLNNQTAFNILAESNHIFKNFEINENLIFWILSKQMFTKSQQQILNDSNFLLNENYTKFQDLVNERYFLALINTLMKPEVRIESIEGINSDEIPLFINKDFIEQFDNRNTNQKIILSTQIQIIFNTYSEEANDKSKQSCNISSPINAIQKQSKTLDKNKSGCLSVDEKQDKEEKAVKSVDEKQDKEEKAVKSVDEKQDKEEKAPKSVDEKQDKKEKAVKSVDEKQDKEEKAVKSVDEKQDKEEKAPKSVDEKQGKEEKAQSNSNDSHITKYVPRPLKDNKPKKKSSITFDQQFENVNNDDDDDDCDTNLINTISMSRDSYNDYSNYTNQGVSLSNEDIEEKSILDTVNYFSEKMFSNEYPVFTKFSKTLQKDFIPKFVMKFFGVASIENVNLLETNEDKFTNQNKDNFYSVIKFLIKKEQTFKYLVFSFKTSLERNYSAKLFFNNLFNLFFITESKEEMFKRCHTLIDSNKQKYIPNFSKASKDEKILVLLKMINTKGIDENVLQYRFIETSIPLIYNIEQDNDINDYESLPDSYYYQLQILFDNFSAKYQNFNQNQHQNITAKRHKSGYFQRYSINKQTYSKTKSFSQKGRYIQITEPYQFWNFESNTKKYNFKYKDGLMKNDIEISQIYNLDINKLFENENVSNKKRYKRSNSFIKRNKYETKASLYKIFYYDEINLEWKFNIAGLKQLSREHRINLNNSVIPLVFYANSKEEDVIKINEKLISFSYPNLAQNDNEIYVYALCENTLSNLLIKRNDQSFNYNDGKPIFLMIHVPKSKEKLANLPLILFQIHYYLSCICNCGIVVLDSKDAQHQISYFKSVIELSQLSFKNEISNVSRFRSFDQYSGYNEKEIIFKKMDIIFLFKLNQDSFNINQKDIEDIKLSKYNVLIDIDSYGLYNDFLNTLVTILRDNKSFYFEVEQNFNSISLSHLCMKYIQSRQSEEWKDLLETFITNRIDAISHRYKDPIQIDGNVKKCHLQNEIIYIISQILDELRNFVPLIDSDYVKEYQDILEKKRKESSGNDNLLKELLEKSSLAFMNDLNKNIQNWTYLSKENINNVYRLHENFLENDFFEIIKAISYDNRNLYLYYYDYLKVLNQQMKDDEQKLQKIIEKFEQTNENREKVVKTNPNDDVYKGTNFVLKEKLNMREIDVTVEENKSLTDVIKQDF